MIKFWRGMIPIAALGILLSCEAAPQPPPRPTGVPLGAEWAGGVDGGCFILCNLDTRQSAYDCIIYSDSTGDIQAQGFYVFKDGREVSGDLSGRYQGFNGHRISLREGLYLVRRQDGPAPRQ